MARDRLVVLADVDTVRVRVGDQVGAIVEDEQRAVGGAQRRVAPSGGDERRIVGVLVAQLHDVDAAAERTVDQRVVADVADEVQTCPLQPLAAGVHALESGRRSAVPSVPGYGSPTPWAERADAGPPTVAPERVMPDREALRMATTEQARTSS